MHRYSVAGHGSMLADGVRVAAYAKAIRQCVKPGDAVLEIGTGTGLFAILASQAGARRVYAIEADDIIESARENAAANGCAAAIEFIHAMSTEVTLPEPVDVIVSDLRGVLPFYENHLGAIADARRRFLVPGGALIPRADRILLACVEDGERYLGLTAPWTEAKFGVEMPAARGLVINDWQRAVFRPDQMLTESVCCARIDYATVEDPGMKAQVDVRALRAGIGHGLALSFEAELADGIGFSTSLDSRGPASIYGHAFFPWPEPVPLAAGDVVTVAIGTTRVAGDYVWTWETRCAAAHFRQSNFHGAPLSAAKLRRRAADHVAAIDDEARVDGAILALMGEGRQLGEIATQLLSRYPRLFPRWEEALARVGELSVKYGR